MFLYKEVANLTCTIIVYITVAFCVEIWIRQTPNIIVLYLYNLQELYKYINKFEL